MGFLAEVIFSEISNFSSVTYCFEVVVNTLIKFNVLHLSKRWNLKYLSSLRGKRSHPLLTPSLSLPYPSEVFLASHIRSWQLAKRVSYPQAPPHQLR